MQKEKNPNIVKNNMTENQTKHKNVKVDERYTKTNKNIAILPLETYPTEVCTYVHQKTNVIMLIATLFLIIKNKDNPNAHQYYYRKINCLFRQWNTTQQ